RGRAARAGAPRTGARTARLPASVEGTHGATVRFRGNAASPEAPASAAAPRRHRGGDGDRLAARLRHAVAGRVGTGATVPRGTGHRDLGAAVRAPRLVGRTHARRRAGG